MVDRVAKKKTSPLRLLLIGAAAMALLDFLFLSFFPIKGFDTWWLLSAGREMVRSRSFLTRDIFTCTIYGLPWMNKYIPFEVLIYSIFSVFGPNGLIALRSILLLLSLLLCFSPVFVWRKRGILSHDPFFGIALLIPFMGVILSRRMFVKPELFSLVFFSASVFLWETYRDRALNPRFWIVILLLQLVWTNFHSAFFVAFPMAGFYLLERGVRKKRILSPEWSILGGLILISLINPYGYNLHKGVFDVMRTPQYHRFIVEWRPLFRTDYPFFHKMVIVGMASATFVGFVLNARNPRIAHMGLFTLLLFLTLQSRRHAVLLGLFSPVVNLWNYGYWYEGWREKVRMNNAVAYIITAALWGFLLFFSYMISSQSLYKREILNGPFGFGIDKDRYPWASADFLESCKIQGNILSRYRDGGFLIWKLAPHVRPCLDGRAEPFPLRLLERYWNIFTGEESPDAFCREYDVSLALIDYQDQHLLRHFRNNKEWGLCFLGFHEALFFKRTPRNEPILEAYEIPLSFPMSKEVKMRLRLPSPGELSSLSPYSDYRRIVEIRIYLMKTLGITDPETQDDRATLSLIFDQPKQDK